MKQHRGIWLPDGDTHFAGHLDKGPMIAGAGTYQLNKLQEGIRLCKQRRTAIDVGAHVGLWSRVLATKFHAVIAFEPVPEHAECFRKNLTLKHDNPNGRGRVILHEVALGNHDGSMFFERVKDNSGNARVAVGNVLDTIKVTIHRLDDYILDHHLGIDFMKIDVEGWEVEVVKGAENTIKRHKPVMVVEQKSGHGQRYGVSDRAAVDLLLTWGYREVWCKNGDHCLVWK